MLNEKPDRLKYTLFIPITENPRRFELFIHPVPDFPWFGISCSPPPPPILWLYKRGVNWPSCHSDTQWQGDQRSCRARLAKSEVQQVRYSEKLSSCNRLKLRQACRNKRRAGSWLPRKYKERLETKRGNEGFLLSLLLCCFHAYIKG